MTFIKSDYYEYFISDAIVPSMFTTLHPRSRKLLRAINLSGFASHKESSRFYTIFFSICVANIVLTRILGRIEKVLVVKL